MKLNYFLLAFFLCSFTTINAQFGRCLDFDGDNDYINLGDVLNMGTSDFSIEFWMNMSTFNPIGNLRRYPIGKGTSVNTFPSGAGYAINLDVMNGVNQVRFIVNVQHIITANDFETNRWYHIAGVREGTNMSLYVDGELAASGTTDEIVNVDTEGLLSIGTIQRSNGNTPAPQGRLDEMRMWDYARTPEEIQADLSRELTGNEAGLLAYFDFNAGVPQGDNGSGCFNNNPCVNVLADKSNNSFDGNLLNFSLFGEHSNWVDANTVLPIELLEFDGELVHQGVQLKWTSLLETNLKTYEVQHAIDGKTWYTIGSVERSEQSTSGKFYHLTHKNPNQGLNYYRLKILDFSERFEFSETIDIHFNSVPIVNVYPNPTSGILKIDGDNIEGATVKAFNSFGKVVFETIYANQTIDISSLPHGIYWLHLQHQEEKISIIQKIIKYRNIP